MSLLAGAIVVLGVCCILIIVALFDGLLGVCVGGCLSLPSWGYCAWDVTYLVGLLLS